MSRFAAYSFSSLACGYNRSFWRIGRRSGADTKRLVSKLALRYGVDIWPRLRTTAAVMIILTQQKKIPRYSIVRTPDDSPFTAYALFVETTRCRLSHRVFMIELMCSMHSSLISVVNASARLTRALLSVDYNTYQTPHAIMHQTP